LRDNPTQEILKHRINVIREGYGNFTNLSWMMRQLAWYSIAVILDLNNNYNIAIPLSEYTKFVRLEQQARNLRNSI
jgi:hypothetical protein